MRIKGRFLNKYISLMLFVLFLLPNSVFAACSGYQGKASLNELHSGLGSNDAFVEVKLIDIIDKSITDQWNLRVCKTEKVRGQDTVMCLSDISLSTFTDVEGSHTWLLKEDASSSGLSDYIDFGGAFDISLRDESDNIVDYMRIGSDSHQDISSCNVTSLPYWDDDLENLNINGGSKYIYRMEDGFGTYQKNQPNDNGTPNNNNNGNPTSYPNLSVNDVTVTQGESLSFTVSLVDVNGSPTTSNSVVSFRYKTIDGTAIGDTHFDKVDLTYGEIAIGLSSVTLSAIATNRIGDNVTRSLTLSIGGASAANIGDGIGLGTINPFEPPVFSCDVTFVDGATSHSPSGSINFSSNSSLLDNGDSILQAPTVTNAALTNTCNNVENCQASGTPTQAIDLGDFQETTSTDDLTVSLFSPKTIGDSGDNEYDSISVWFGGHLTTSSSQSLYKIKSLRLYGIFSRLSLAPGDYYIENLTIGGGSIIYITSPGEVRLYVKNSFSVGSNSFLNNSPPSDDYELIIAGYDDITVNTGARVRAKLYSEKDTTLSSSTYLYGETSAVNVNLSNSARIYNQCPTSAPSIDHFQIIHDGNGLTCDSETVTVKACTNTFDGTCTEASEDVSLSLIATGSGSSPHIVTSPLTISASDNSANKGKATFNYTIAESVALSIANTSISATNGYVCNDNSSGSCNLAFVDAGFLIDGFKDIEVAGVPNGVVTIQAVETNTSTGVCDPLFDNAAVLDIEFAIQAISPSSTAGLAYKMGTVGVGNHVDIDKNTGTPTDYKTVSLTFGNSSTAFLPENVYLDAGIINLRAKYTIAATSDNPAETLYGSSGNFTVRPFAFQITPKNSTGDPLTGSSSNASVTQKAGEGFDLLIEAVNADWLGDGSPDITANYTGVDVDLALERVAPSSLTASEGILIDDTGLSLISSLSSTPINYSSSVTFTDGIYQSNSKAVKFSEVGIYKIHVSEKDTISPDNTTTGNKATGSEFLGRFTPDHFELEVIDDGSIPALCGIEPAAFTYTGQMDSTIATEGALRYGDTPVFTITAKSATCPSGVCETTKNYTGSFVKLLETGITRVSPLTDGTKDGINSPAEKLALQSDILASYSLPATIPEGFGILTFSYNDDDHFVYTKEKNALVLPFESDINLEITSVIDSDGISAWDYDPADDADYSGVLTLHPQGSEIRFGRLNLENTFGPETSSLPIVLKTQYWDGTQWQTNTLDTCTIVDSANLTADNSNISPSSTTPSGDGILALGENRDIILSAPGTQGAVPITYDPALMPWLLFDWDNTDGNSDGPYDDNPSATATFGLFRGNDRIIYWRELLQ